MCCANGISRARLPALLVLPVLGCCLLLPAGCAPFTDAYPGPFRGLNEVAVVTGRASLIGEPGYEDVFINSIDGKREIGGWTAPTQEVQILPGTHIIGVVEAKAIEGAEPVEEFKDQARLALKVIVGARYGLGYNPATKEFMAVRVGLGPVPFELVE